MSAWFLCQGPEYPDILQADLDTNYAIAHRRMQEVLQKESRTADDKVKAAEINVARTRTRQYALRTPTRQFEMKSVHMVLHHLMVEACCAHCEVHCQGKWWHTTQQSRVQGVDLVTAFHCGRTCHRMPCQPAADVQAAGQQSAGGAELARLAGAQGQAAAAEQRAHAARDGQPQRQLRRPVSTASCSLCIASLSLSPPSAQVHSQACHPPPAKVVASSCSLLQWPALMALSHCRRDCRRSAHPLACLAQKDQAETGGLTLGTCRSVSGASASSLLDAPAALCTVSLRATPDSKAGALDARAAGGLCPVPENGTRFQQVKFSDCCCLMQHCIRPDWSLADLYLHGDPVQSWTPVMPHEARCSLSMEAS